MSEQISPSLAGEVLEAAPWAVVVSDSQGKPLWSNRTFKERFRVSDEGLSSLLKATDPMPLGSADGGTTWVQHRAVPLSAPGGDMAHYFLDVTGQMVAGEERDRLAKALEEQALHDPLTGVLNLRALGLALQPQVARSRRYGSALALVAVEVAAAGDEAAQAAIAVQTARWLQGQVRWADLLARDDAGPFILALPETDVSAAEKLVHKLVNGLGELAAQAAGAESLRVSFGLTAWRSGDDMARLMRRAGDALEAARHSSEPFVIR